MQKVRESLLRMSVFNVANMVTGEYKYGVCLIYEFCLSLQPFHHLSFFHNYSVQIPVILTVVIFFTKIYYIKISIKASFV